MKGLIVQDHARWSGKVVDPSNPISVNEKGEFSRTLPDGVSAGSVISGMSPPTAYYVKASGRFQLSRWRMRPTDPGQANGDLRCSLRGRRYELPQHPRGGHSGGVQGVERERRRVPKATD